VKTKLVVGVGNSLMGDDGAGWYAIQSLATDPRLPGDTDLLWAGSDLLRCAADLEGRRRVVLVDALLNPGRAGSVFVFDEPFPDLDGDAAHVHRLSPVQTIGLLRLASPAIASVCFTLVAIAIAGANCTATLSAEVSAGMPRLVDEALRQLGR